jgi:pullulanase
MKTFRAVWDAVCLARVSLSRDYYNGETATLTLVDQKDERFSLEFSVNCEEADGLIYDVVLPVLSFEGRYVLEDDRGLRAPLEFGLVVQSDEFDTYFYTDELLGSFYEPTKTTFKVWAPTADGVQVMIGEKNKQQTVALSYMKKGVWQVDVEGDYEAVPYIYLVKHGSLWHEAIDPYGLASVANHRASVVIDFKKIENRATSHRFDPWVSPNQSILYELSVRDFTRSSSSGVHHAGTYKGFVESGTRIRGENHDGSFVEMPTGIDYLSDLGVTHVQLMPVYDFGSVDELNPKERYNWGYDPVQYTVPEGSLATDVSSPYTRIYELQDLVSALHKRGLGVIMDVVYNHMFDRDTSSFEAIVPGYYFRVGVDGRVSNGSFCGSDMDSTRKMFRRYVVDATATWMSLYGMDGFRFDLMGILDIHTMNEVYALATSINPQALIYGEGWNMPTLLEDAHKAMLYNAQNLPGIAFFNDYFRDTIKGATMHEEIKGKGYASGKLQLAEKALSTVLAQCYLSPSQAINYVECHDNHTLWDKLEGCCAHESYEVRRHRQLLMTSMVLMSFGTPFLHSGQEWCRTKNGDHNSYRSSDAVNAVDWGRALNHISCIEKVKGLISIRKSIPFLWEPDGSKVSRGVSTEQLSWGGFSYRFLAEEDSKIEIIVTVNPSKRSIKHNLPKTSTCLYTSRVDLSVNQIHASDPLAPLSLAVWKHTKVKTE